MTPIERVRRRAEAASRLNVPFHSTQAELKKEWHRRAFETHPDRDGGDAAAFREMRMAFEILAGTAGDEVRFDRVEKAVVRPRRVVSRTPSRTVRPEY